MKKENISFAAQSFLRLIKSGILLKEILPNSSPNYTESQEKRDTDYYTRVFLNSSSYDLIKESEATEYNGE